MQTVDWSVLLASTGRSKQPASLVRDRAQVAATAVAPCPLIDQVQSLFHSASVSCVSLSATSRPAEGE